MAILEIFDHKRFYRTDADSCTGGIGRAKTINMLKEGKD